MYKQKLVQRFCMIALVLLSVVACAPKPQPKITQAQIIAHLQQHHVQVIRQGSSIQFILPTDRFFVSPGNQLQHRQKQTLKWLALYLHRYLAQHPRAYPVKVAGYSDKVYTKQYRKLMSREYAQVVAAYLWASGFSHRQLHIVGYGALSPIATNRTVRGSAYNRRVVIEVKES